MDSCRSKYVLHYGYAEVSWQTVKHICICTDTSPSPLYANSFILHTPGSQNSEPIIQAGSAESRFWLSITYHFQKIYPQKVFFLYFSCSKNVPKLNTAQSQHIILRLASTIQRIILLGDKTMVGGTMQLINKSVCFYAGVINLTINLTINVCHTVCVL